MWRPLRELTLILLAIAGALVVSQLPGFVAAYEQRLGGALQEAQRTLGQFVQDATKAGFGFQDYVARLRENADPAVAATGGTVQALAQRTALLSDEATELAAAGKLAKPLVLMRHHDSDLLQASWAAYRVSPTLDIEFGVMGMLLGWLINGLIWAMLGPRRVRD